jgi:hypothetical protein
MQPYLESDPNHYCRLFAPTDPPRHAEEWSQIVRGLAELVDAMEDDGSRPDGPDFAIDAGYTYFGQFVDHDITKDATALASAISLETSDSIRLEPGQIVNNQTPRLDLGHVYGNGPFDPIDKKLYETGGVKLRVGDSVPSTILPGAKKRSFDVALDENGQPLVADSRASENIILRQITAVFARLHNVAVDQWRSEIKKPAELFDRARQQTLWQFQWLIANDYLPTVLDQSVYERVFVDQKPKLRWKTFSIPIEFSVGAMRFGHSMVRDAYLISNGTAIELGDLLRVGLKPGALDSKFEVDWGRMFSGAGPGGPATTAQPIDARISKGMYKIPMGTLKLFNPGHVPAMVARDATASEIELRLPLITLLRGVAMRLPSGQTVAEKFGVKKLSATEITDDIDSRKTNRGAALKKAALVDSTPLWFYVLKESEVKQNGTVGPTGSNIIAETLHAALRYDPTSYLNQPKTVKIPPVWKFGAESKQLLSLSSLFEAALQF